MSPIVTIAGIFACVVVVGMVIDLIVLAWIAKHFDD